MAKLIYKDLGVWPVVLIGTKAKKAKTATFSEKLTILPTGASGCLEPAEAKRLPTRLLQTLQFFKKPVKCIAHLL